jgi:hypothetical protein
VIFDVLALEEEQLIDLILSKYFYETHQYLIADRPADSSIAFRTLRGNALFRALSVAA